MLAGFNDDEVLRMLSALLTKAAQHAYSYFGNQFHITVSIGMTKYQPGQTLENMMGKADRALYQSKAQGRNRFTVL
jgi:diguanylate cyclase (GGDEF)-like protein